MYVLPWTEGGGVCVHAAHPTGTTTAHALSIVLCIVLGT